MIFSLYFCNISYKPIFPPIVILYRIINIMSYSKFLNLKSKIYNLIYLIASLKLSRFSIAIPTPRMTQNNGSSTTKEATPV